MPSENLTYWKIQYSTICPCDFQHTDCCWYLQHSLETPVSKQWSVPAMSMMCASIDVHGIPGFTDHMHSESANLHPASWKTYVVWSVVAVDTLTGQSLHCHAIFLSFTWCWRCRCICTCIRRAPYGLGVSIGNSCAAYGTVGVFQTISFGQIHWIFWKRNKASKLLFTTWGVSPSVSEFLMKNVYGRFKVVTILLWCDGLTPPQTDSRRQNTTLSLPYISHACK